MLRKSMIALAAALAVGGAAFAQGQMAPGAQTAGIKRTVIQKFDVPAGDRETVVAVIEIPRHLCGRKGQAARGAGAAVAEAQCES